MDLFLQNFIKNLFSKKKNHLVLVAGLIMIGTTSLLGQCPSPPAAIPDGGNPVDGDFINSYCVTYTFNLEETGIPTGISMELNHSWQGDLSIAVIVRGDVLNVMQRPGTDNCLAGCGSHSDGCGDNQSLDGNYIFTDSGTDPEEVMTINGGSYGVTADDACGIGTVGSFADLFAPFADFPPDEIISASICITDHAEFDLGLATDVSFLFPNTDVICGCADPLALNYDSTAFVYLNSCIFACPDLGLTVEQDYFELCEGYADFQLTANAPIQTTGPLAGVVPTYEWTATNGADVYIVNPLSANTQVSLPPGFLGSITYTVTATFKVDDGAVFFLCEDSKEVDIFVSESPYVEIVGPSNACIGELVTLEVVTGPFSDYFWSGTDQTGSVVIVEPGAVYTVIVTDVFGCSADAVFSVGTFPEVRSEIIGDFEFCPGTTTTLFAEEAYNAYEWSTGENSNSIVVNTPGVYEVSVIDENDCVASTAVEITELLSPSPIIDGAGFICEYSGAVLAVEEAYNAYEWSTGENSNSIVVNTPGVYEVTVIDENGCEGFSSIVIADVPAPVPNIIGNNDLCPGDLTTLSVDENYIHYEWSTGETSSSIIVDASGLYEVTVTGENGCEGFSSITILDIPSPTPTIIGDSEFCSGTTTTLFAEEVYNAYEWSTGENSNSIVVNTPGVYELTVTDENGCEGFSSIVIADVPAPVPNIIGNNELCFGATAILLIEEIYSVYEWSTGATTSSITVDGPGLYGVTIVDDYGCLGYSSFEVYTVWLPTPTIIGDSEFCSGTTTILFAEEVYNAYEWSTGETSNSIVVNTPGVYGLTVTNGTDCTAFTEIEITELPLPDPVIYGDDLLCEGLTSVLEVENIYSTYEWSTGETSNSIDLFSSGLYEVTVTGENGCQGFDSIEVNYIPPPIPSIIGNNDLCLGTTTILSVAENYSYYEWSTGATTSSITVDSPGLYEVLVIDDYGCEGFSFFEVYTASLPTPIIVGGEELCPGALTALLAIGDYNYYEWSTGETTPSIIIDAPGLYEVLVVDDYGCEGVAFFDVEELEVANLEISGEDEICEGEETILQATSGFAVYDWNTNENSESITVNEQGVYTVEATDEHGCTVDAVFELTIHPGLEVVLNIMNDILSTSEQDGSIEAIITGGAEPYFYTWDNGATTNVIENLGEGLYQLTVTDANECNIEASGEINIVTSITELEDEQLKVFPNPSPGYFNIEYYGSSSIQNIEVFTIEGKSISFSSVETNHTDSFTLLLPDVANGSYILLFQIGEDHFFKKVVVQR